MSGVDGGPGAVVGFGEFRYRAVDPLARLPADWKFGEACGVATDSRDRVYVFNRGDHPVIVLDPDGKGISGQHVSYRAQAGRG